MFGTSPWGFEGKTGVFCYECHEELLHNPVLLPDDVAILAELIRRRALNEDDKPSGRDKIAGRVQLFQEVISGGLRSLLQQPNGLPETTEAFRAVSTEDCPDVCAMVHRLLEQLPLWREPGQVPFTNGLYFFYVEGFRDAIMHALGFGMHVLVESGGYGLIRVEESIWPYEAEISRTAVVWRKVLPEVLAHYVSRNRISEVFVAGSRQYAGIISRPEWWKPATCWWFISYVGRGLGSPYRIVPTNLGTAVRDLLRSHCRPNRSWVRS
jgi:hypothetical protein